MAIAESPLRGTSHLRPLKRKFVFHFERRFAEVPIEKKWDQDRIHAEIHNRLALPANLQICGLSASRAADKAEAVPLAKAWDYPYHCFLHTCPAGSGKEQTYGMNYGSSGYERLEEEKEKVEPEETEEKPQGLCCLVFNICIRVMLPLAMLIFGFVAKNLGIPLLTHIFEMKIGGFEFWRLFSCCCFLLLRSFVTSLVQLSFNILGILHDRMQESLGWGKDFDFDEMFLEEMPQPTANLLRLGVLVGALQVLDLQHYSADPNTGQQLHTILMLIIMLSLGPSLLNFAFCLVNVLNKGLQEFADQKDSPLESDLVWLISSAIRVFVCIAIAYFVMLLLGLDPTVILTILASAGLGIALGFQGTVQSLAGLLIVLLGKQIKLNDLIKIADITGFVHEFKLTHTVVKGWDHRITFLPNSEFLTIPLTNYSLQSAMRIQFDWVISFEPDATRKILNLKRKLLEWMRDGPWKEWIIQHQHGLGLGIVNDFEAKNRLECVDLVADGFKVRCIVNYNWGPAMSRPLHQWVKGGKWEPAKDQEWKGWFRYFNVRIDVGLAIDRLMKECSLHYGYAHVVPMTSQVPGALNNPALKDNSSGPAIPATAIQSPTTSPRQVQQQFLRDKTSISPPTTPRSKGSHK